MKRKLKTGRPPEYVEYDGETVKGLSLKTDGRYYSTHNHPKTGKREYFGTELDYAVRLFKSWRRRIARKNGRKT